MHFINLINISTLSRQKNTSGIIRYISEGPLIAVRGCKWLLGWLSHLLQGGFRVLPSWGQYLIKGHSLKVEAIVVGLMSKMYSDISSKHF